MATIHDLAPEILAMICEWLCRHCNGDAYSIDDDFEEQDCQEDLKAVCLTSRLLRRIAQPILYHRICFMGDLMSLIRTLEQRPDLAACVKQFREDSCGTWDTDEELLTLRPIMERLTLLPKTQVRLRPRRTFQSTCAEMMIAICASGLEELELRTLPGPGTSRRDPVLQILNHRFRQQAQQGIVGLPSLQRLHLISKPLVYYFHGSNNRSIIAAAPNLKHLTFEGLVSCPEGLNQAVFTHELANTRRLRSLRFLEIAVTEQAVSDKQLLERLIKRNPHLESFEFSSFTDFGPEPEFEGHVTAAWVTSILEPRASALKSLRINLANYSTEEQTGSPIARFVLEDSALDKFTQLETLQLDEGSFCRRESHTTMLGWKAPGNCLIRLVPRTVKLLNVMITRDSRVWEDLEEIAVAAKDGDFPDLERIELMTFWGNAMPRRERSRLDEETERGWVNLAPKLKDVGIVLFLRF